MKVSAIIPTYDHAHLLPRALASIASQTWRDIEVVVVDDGSHDETDRVVHEIAASFPFLVRFFRQPNAGCASARNHGLRVATGDAIAFLDSDDEWTPDAIEQLVTTLEISGADFAYSPAIEIDESGRETVQPPVAAGQPDRLARDHFERTDLRNGSVLFRRSAIDAVGGFDETLRHREDSDLHQRVAIHCTAAYVDTPSVRVFETDERKSANRAAILNALLTSSQGVLERNPGFAKSLGARAGERVDEIRALLLDALILEGDFRAARLVANELDSRSGVGQRLSLALGSTRPYTLAQRVNAVWRSWIEARRARRGTGEG